MLECDLDYLEKVAKAMANAPYGSVHPEIVSELMRHSAHANRFGECLLNLIQEYKEAINRE